MQSFLKKGLLTVSVILISAGCGIVHPVNPFDYKVPSPTYAPKKVMCSNKKLNHCDNASNPEKCGGCIMIWEEDFWGWADDLKMFCMMMGSPKKNCSLED